MTSAATPPVPGAPAPDAPPAAAPPAWTQALVVAAATGLAYANSFQASFHFDDHAVIVSNPAIGRLEALWPPESPRWLGDVTFALNHRLGGLEVGGYHLVNLLIHVGGALLLLALARTVLRTPGLRGAASGPLLRGWLPLVAALLFALHPLATQAVTYLVQRTTALATLFFLASLLLLVRARLALEEAGRWTAGAAGQLALSVVAAACAMKSKEIAFPLPAVALAAELLLFGGRPWRRLLLLLPLAATALLVPLAHLPDQEGALAPRLAETEVISRGDYLLTQSRVLVTYLRLLVLPVGQHLDWDFPLSRSLLEPAVLGSLALLAALGAGATWGLLAARRAGRAEGVLVFLGAGWFFATIALESSIIPIRDVLVEHRTYLPSAGFALAAATGLLAGLERLRLRAHPALQVGVLLLVTAGPLGAATWARNEVWRDDLSLWRDSAEKSPGKARPHDAVGVALLERGRFEEAIPEFQRALALQLIYPEAMLNLGSAYRATGQLDEALRMYRRLVEVLPTMWEGWNNLGVVCEELGRRDEALQAYREAARLAPGRPDPARNLVRLLTQRGATGGSTGPP